MENPNGIFAAGRIRTTRQTRKRSPFTRTQS
jgi:hypothetical protein